MITQTLLADEQAIYDPREPNDRLLLGVKGTISEAELFETETREGFKTVWHLIQRATPDADKGAYEERLDYEIQKFLNLLPYEPGDPGDPSSQETS